MLLLNYLLTINYCNFVISSYNNHYFNYVFHRMPPITRHQLRKCNLKPEPYSKENRQRTALSDLVSNNVRSYFY